MKRFFTPLIIMAVIAYTVTSCVPAKKFEDLKSKQEKCEEELEALKAKSQDLEEQNNELTAELEELKKEVVKLRKDTTLLGNSLRNKEVQYDKINELNAMIQRQLETLQKGSAEENRKLMAQLEEARLDLQKREDKLRILEQELALKEKALEEREVRVNELEDLLAKKDEAVAALKNKVAQALLSFKDKGLSVEQKNGKVYVSMEAKLLFPSGSTEIDPEGKKALVELAKVLETQKDLEIIVEGHTDTDKINSSRIPRDNWELSVLRATAVVKLLLKNSDMIPETVTAAGKSEYVPVDPDDKAKNRRIEIVLAPNLDELFNIIERGE